MLLILLPPIQLIQPKQWLTDSILYLITLEMPTLVLPLIGITILGSFKIIFQMELWEEEVLITLLKLIKLLSLVLTECLQDTLHMLLVLLFHQEQLQQPQE